VEPFWWWLKVECRRVDFRDAGFGVLKFCGPTVLSDTENKSCEKLISVSYVLDLPHEFMDASERLIRHRRSLDKEQYTIRGHDFVPKFLIGAYPILL
jgi:hypothetical protein